MTMLRQKLTTAAAWIASPGVFAHEFCHFIASLPVADQAAIVVGENEHTTAEHVWAPRDDVSRWQLAMVAVAPSVLGAIAGLLGLWRLQTAPPQTGSGLVMACVLAAYWVLIIIPSAEDLQLPDTEHNDNDYD
jgi:hypothetical protein